MTRPIKFRAWDGKRMLDNPRFEFFSHGKNGPAVMMADENENVEIMQFTGLTDKNGKEIYEGDVVCIVPDETKEWANNPLKEFPYGGIAKVYYDDINAGFWLDNGDDQTSMGYYAGWSGWNWLEVIGNIFENPELLA